MARCRFVSPALAVLALVAMAVTDPAAQRGTGATTTNASWEVPRTPWGDPDLQGIWPSSDMIGVPLQRDQALGTRAVLTDEEFAQRQQQAARQAAADNEEFDARAAAGGGGVGPPPHWLERGNPQRQASLIVDPPNGRLPAMTPDGEARTAERARRSSTGEGPFNGPADLDYYDRCISRGVLGSIAPVIWTAPWTVSFPLKRDDEYGFYEYACHEGNHAMRNILAGARAEERRTQVRP